VALLRALENSINSYFHRASTAAYQLPYGCQPVDRLTETGSHRTAATTNASLRTAGSFDHNRETLPRKAVRSIGLVGIGDGSGNHARGSFTPLRV
jgi:hypothetical protein